MPECAARFGRFVLFELDRQQIGAPGLAPHRSVAGRRKGVLGGAPAERARRLGAPARPNGGRSRTLPRRGHPHRPPTATQVDAKQEA